MYELIYEKRVLKDLDKIPDGELIKILESIKGLSKTPTPPKYKKLFQKPPLYRIRQGDYRTIYNIDHKEKIVRIIFVGNRKDVYRRL